MTPAELLASLRANEDERVASWAQRTTRRIQTRQTNCGREIARLLKPFVDAGLIERDGDAYKLTLEYAAELADELGTAVAHEPLRAAA